MCPLTSSLPFQMQKQRVRYGKTRDACFWSRAKLDRSTGVSISILSLSMNEQVVSLSRPLNWAAAAPTWNDSRTSGSVTALPRGIKRPHVVYGHVNAPHVVLVFYARFYSYSSMR